MPHMPEIVKPGTPSSVHCGQQGPSHLNQSLLAPRGRMIKKLELDGEPGLGPGRWARECRRLSQCPGCCAQALAGLPTLHGVLICTGAPASPGGCEGSQEQLCPGAPRTHCLMDLWPWPARALIASAALPQQTAYCWQLAWQLRVAIFIRDQEGKP